MKTDDERKSTTKCSAAPPLPPSSPAGWRDSASPARPSQTAGCPPPGAAARPGRWSPWLLGGPQWLSGSPEWPSGPPAEPGRTQGDRLLAEPLMDNLPSADSLTIIIPDPFGITHHRSAVEELFAAAVKPLLIFTELNNIFTDPLNKTSTESFLENITYSFYAKTVFLQRNFSASLKSSLSDLFSS